ncbi:Tat pathway signal sequence domain protein [Kitasatospora sp. NPDC059673]|uniref:Tat pathway signal sequence domain protein n=1 Tax=Kitasatospora sp. NPDC059673 TaxID=3346901 RepID=UPI003682D339
MRNRLFARTAALAAATVLLALPAGTAGAMPGTPVLHTTGPAVNTGNPLSADLVAGTVATMYNPGTTTGVKCLASHIGGTLAVNPNPPVIVSGPVDTLTFSACTSNEVGIISVLSLTMNYLPYTLAISDSTGYPVTLTPSAGSILQATVVLKTLAGNATCFFRANVLNGYATNNLTQINLVKQPLTKSSGPSICFPSIEFSASYSPITYGGATALVN